MGRLLIVPTTMPVEGPWVLPRGSEKAVRVSGLTEGVEARLEVQMEGREPLSIGLQSGLNPIDIKGWKKYRAIRSGRVHTEPTTIEVVTQ